MPKRMTLDDAIAHCKEAAQRIRADGCEECALEHEQLAEWLEDLAAFRARQQKRNEPMTKDEVRKMTGQWVWIVYHVDTGTCEGWAYVGAQTVRAYLKDGPVRLWIDDCGAGSFPAWSAFRCPPGGTP